jgi:hypothetical protein
MKTLIGLKVILIDPATRVISEVDIHDMSMFADANVMVVGVKASMFDIDARVGSEVEYNSRAPLNDLLDLLDGKGQGVD